MAPARVICDTFWHQVLDANATRINRVDPRCIHIWPPQAYAGFALQCACPLAVVLGAMCDMDAFLLPVMLFGNLACFVYAALWVSVRMCGVFDLMHPYHACKLH